jgi:site-specific recombinase XerD
MKPLDEAVRSAFLEAARGRGVAAGDVWGAVIVRIKEEGTVRQYSPKTFDAYAGWVRQFASFAGKPPDGIAMQDVKDFLTHLAVDGRVVASTQNQAFNRTIQELLGHSDVRTTMIDTHTVPSRTQKERASPLDLWERATPA